MFTIGEADTAPVLQYSVEVTKRDPPNQWQRIPNFVSGHPRRPISKEVFYSRLKQTPDAALPKVEQLVEITFRQEPPRRTSGSGSATGSSSNSNNNSSSSTLAISPEEGEAWTGWLCRN